MEIVYERCCGIDVHKKRVVACLIVPGPTGAPCKQVRTFGTMTADVLELSDWLTSAAVTHVAMESTGVYWKPLVRHEALLNREGMREPLQRTVAAVR
jgi:transposase